MCIRDRPRRRRRGGCRDPSCSVRLRLLDSTRRRSRRPRRHRRRHRYHLRPCRRRRRRTRVFVAPAFPSGAAPNRGRDLCRTRNRRRRCCYHHRTKKERKTKVSKKDRKRKKRKKASSSSRSLTNKQTNKWTHRPLESLRRHHKEVLGETNAFCLSISSPRRSHRRRRRRNRIAPLGKPEPFRCIVVRAALSSFLRHRFYNHHLCRLLVGRSLVFPQLLFVLPVVSLRAKTDGGGVVTPRKHHLSLSPSLSLSVCVYL